MTFAEKLRKARKEAGLTQRELADRSCMSLRTIANYESGEHLPQKSDTYTALAGALGITADLLTDEKIFFYEKNRKSYGGRGREKAEGLIRSIRIAAADGELDNDDLDFIMEAVVQTCTDAKRYNQKFHDSSRNEFSGDVPAGEHPETDA